MPRSKNVQTFRLGTFEVHGSEMVPMFEFGRDLKRFISGQGHGEADASILSLMPLDMLITQARHYDVESGRVSTKNRFDPALMASQMWRAYAARTGDSLSISKSASAAEYAGKHATTVSQATQAALMQVRTCLLAGDLFGTKDLWGSAESLLAGVRASRLHEPWYEVRLTSMEALLAARQCLGPEAEIDLDRVIAAMARVDQWVELCDQRVRALQGSHARIQAAEARLERATLLLAVALDRHDEKLVEAVLTDLEALLAGLDPDLEPLSHGQVTIRLGQAATLQGKLRGDMGLIAKGVGLLSPKDEPFAYEHAPIQWLEHKLALGQALEIMAMQGGHDQAYDKAIMVYDLASKKPLQKGLSLRSQLIHAKAGLWVGRAECLGEPQAFKMAESQLKAHIKDLQPQKDPVEWAILQTQLAKLYVTSLAHGFKQNVRLEAAYALEAAQDIFSEFGQTNLKREAAQLMSQVSQSVN